MNGAEGIFVAAFGSPCLEPTEDKAVWGNNADARRMNLTDDYSWENTCVCLHVNILNTHTQRMCTDACTNTNTHTQSMTQRSYQIPYHMRIMCVTSILVGFLHDSMSLCGSKQSIQMCEFMYRMSQMGMIV